MEKTLNVKYLLLLLYLLSTYGPSGSQGVSAGVQEGPSIVEEPPPNVVFSSSVGVALSCLASGSPEVSVSWVLTDGSRATTVAGVRDVLSNGTLVLHSFRPEQYRHDVHASIYRCLASNSVGTVTSRPVSVNAVVVQRYEVEVSDATGTIGSPIVFKCDVPPSVARFVTVASWSVDSRTLRPSLHPEGRYWVLPSGELIVEGVTPADAYARVSCAVSHLLDHAHRSSNSARAIVTGEPRLTRPQLLLRREVVRVQQQDPLLLPCISRAHPLPSYSWYREQTSRVRIPLGDAMSNGRVHVVKGTLVFATVQEEDAGVYVCMANNSAGSDSYRVEVVVTRPLSVTIRPSHQRIDLGRSASFTCLVSGHPVARVTWYKDGRTIRPDLRISTYDRSLHIEQVGREDSGMYQCLAHNSHDAAQASAQLDLGDSAPVIEYRFISQTLQPGPSVSLKCIASGSPTPHLTWALDGFPLPQSDRLVVGQYVGVGGAVVSHVNISNVRSEDGGSYSCKAESRAGTASHSARLNVYGPAYVRPMSVVTAVAGEALVLRCPASGFPLASITWSRDGRTLPVNLRQSVHDNGTLIVTYVQKKVDSGSYTCTAKDKQGQQHSATASVQVLVPPKLSPFTFRNDLALGERVSVQCTVNRGDTPLSIGWNKDQISAEHLSGVQVRQYDQYSAVLTIAHLSPAHAGNYTCTARNDAASVEHTAPLNVNVPPSWVVEPRDVGVVLGQAVAVPCQARGFPTPTIKWRRGHADRPGEYSPVLAGMGVGLGVGGAEVASNGSLILRWARSEDEGQYLCEATNGVGGGLSALVRLTVNAPPVLDKSGDSRVSVRRGGSVTLQCEARGDAPIALLWSKDDRPVPQANSLVEEIAGGVRGKLLLTSVETEGAGPYTCKASNTYGQDMFTIMLVVQDVPGPPHGLRVSETGSRSLVVSWLPPRSHHSPVDNYIVSYKVAQEFQHRVWSSGEGEVLVEGHSTSARLAPLVPATLYHVRVAAANTLGQSQPSEPLQVLLPSPPKSGSDVTRLSFVLFFLTSLSVFFFMPMGHFTSCCC